MHHPNRVTADLSHQFEIDEASRLEATDRFDVLDTPREVAFDRIAGLIRSVFATPVGVVSVIDAHRQWFKAADGLALREIPRRSSFCEMTIASKKPFIVSDASADPRFAGNSLVALDKPIRFYAGAPLISRDGHAIGTLAAMDFEPRAFGVDQAGMLSDLACLAMAEFELRRYATIDVLTGLASRSAFSDEGERALALARRHELDLSCIAFEIDDLHLIAERLGKSAADQVIVAVAKTCRRIMRRTDQIGRVGGDTFAIILPHTDRRGAMDAAQKLRAALQALTLDVVGTVVKPTASFGVVTLEMDIDDVDDFLARATASLRDAKAAGGNRCAAWGYDEKRNRHLRRAVLKSGTIHFDAHASRIDCTVRSISEAGAGIDIWNALDLPETFGLTVRPDGLDRSCRIVARSERHLEVAFS